MQGCGEGDVGLYETRVRAVGFDGRMKKKMNSTLGNFQGFSFFLEFATVIIFLILSLSFYFFPLFYFPSLFDFF